MSRRLRGPSDVVDTKSNSGTSSISSGRLERPTRSSLRHEESAAKSITPRSTSNDPEAPAPVGLPARQTRLQRRGPNGSDGPVEGRVDQEEQGDDDDADGEEVTRWLARACGRGWQGTSEDGIHGCSRACFGGRWILHSM